MSFIGKIIGEYINIMAEMNFVFILLGGKYQKRQVEIDMMTCPLNVRLSYPDILSRYLCPGANKRPPDDELLACQCGIKKKTWKVVCKRITVTCHTFVLCDSFQKCVTIHGINNIYCCGYECN